MKRLLLSLTMAALALFPAGAAPTGSAKISLSSSAIQAGGMIPARFTCKGANVNPPLAFGGIPAGAKSLLLIVDDPDAPGGLFTHWLVWNIAPQSTEIVTASVPSGAVEGTNDFGKAGYAGLVHLRARIGISSVSSLSTARSRRGQARIAARSKKQSPATFSPEAS